MTLCRRILRIPSSLSSMVSSPSTCRLSSSSEKLLRCPKLSPSPPPPPPLCGFMLRTRCNPGDFFAASPSFDIVRENCDRGGAILACSVALSGGLSRDKHTTITLTLSAESLRRASLHSSLAAISGSLCPRSAIRVKSIAFCDENTSHRPSHARTMNSSCVVSVRVSTSGVTINGPGFPSAPPFKPSMWKSPNARATPRCPLM
eukprot:30980-Pelagococcus_subviridis.AAC.7